MIPGSLAITGLQQQFLLDQVGQVFLQGIAGVLTQCLFNITHLGGLVIPDKVQDLLLPLIQRGL